MENINNKQTVKISIDVKMEQVQKLEDFLRNHDFIRYSFTVTSGASLTPFQVVILSVEIVDRQLRDITYIQNKINQILESD